MATGQKFINWYRDRVLAREDMRDHFQNYLKTLLKNNIGQSWGKSGLFKHCYVVWTGTDLRIDDQGSRDHTDPAYELTHGVTVEGNELFLPLAYSHGIPFPNTAATDYWVGMYYCEVPNRDSNGITKSVYPPKEYGYSYTEEAVGVVGIPSGVTVTPTNIRLQLTGILENDLSQEGRPVFVYLNTPKTDNSTVAFANVLVEYDAGVNYVDIPYDLTVGDYPLGQGTNESSNPVSTDVNDYRCYVPGVTISTTDLSADESCVLLATVVGDHPNAPIINNESQIYIYYTLDDAYNGLVGEGIGRTIDVKHGAVLFDAPSVTGDLNLDGGDVKGALLNIRTNNPDQKVVPIVIESKKEDDGSGGITSAIDVIEPFTGESGGINGFPQQLDAVILNDGGNDHLCVNNTTGLTVADFDNIYDNLNYISIVNDENKGLFTITNVYDSGETDGSYGPVALELRRFSESATYTLLASSDIHHISFYFPNVQIGSTLADLTNSKDGMCVFSHPAILGNQKDVMYKGIGYSDRFLQYLHIPDKGSVFPLTGANYFEVDGLGRINTYNDFINTDPFIRIENQLSVNDVIQLFGYNDGDSYVRVQRLNDGIVDTEDWMRFYSEYTGERHKRINLDVGRVVQNIDYDDVLYSFDTQFLTPPSTWVDDTNVDNFTWNWFKLQGTDAIKLFKQGTGTAVPAFVHGRLEYQFCNKGTIEQGEVSPDVFSQGSCLVTGQLSLNKRFEFDSGVNGEGNSILDIYRRNGNEFNHVIRHVYDLVRDDNQFVVMSPSGSLYLDNEETTTAKLADFSISSYRQDDPSTETNLIKDLYDIGSTSNHFLSAYQDSQDKLVLDTEGNLIIRGNYFRDGSSSFIVPAVSCVVRRTPGVEGTINDFVVYDEYDTDVLVNNRGDGGVPVIVNCRCYYNVDGIPDGARIKKVFAKVKLNLDPLSEYGGDAYFKVGLYSQGYTSGDIQLINGTELEYTDIEEMSEYTTLEHSIGSDVRIDRSSYAYMLIVDVNGEVAENFIKYIGIEHLG